MGANQLMMGDDEPTRLGPAASFHDNGNYFVRSLFSIVWHNSVVFSMTFVDFVTSSFVVQELFLLVFFFFPFLNKNFQGFNNVTTSYY
jgi:hypothetical protein